MYGEIYQLDPNDYPDEGVIVKAYLPVNSFLGETVDGIKETINNLLLYNIDLGRNHITISEVNEEEWATAWKKYYHPVKISEKFTIVPTWEEYTPVHTDELIIEMGREWLSAQGHIRQPYSAFRRLNALCKRVIR